MALITSGVCLRHRQPWGDDRGVGAVCPQHRQVGKARAGGHHKERRAFLARKQYLSSLKHTRKGALLESSAFLLSNTHLLKSSAFLRSNPRRSRRRQSPRRTGKPASSTSSSCSPPQVFCPFTQLPWPISFPVLWCPLLLVSARDPPCCARSICLPRAIPRRPPCPPSRPPPGLHSIPHPHTHTHTHPHAPKRAHAHTHTHTNARTHTRTHVSTALRRSGGGAHHQGRTTRTHGSTSPSAW